MFQNRFVVTVAVNGILQDEKDGVVYLKEGDEYSIRLRNKHDCKAVAQIYLDGELSSANGWIVPANSYVDIKRYANVDRAFKFVSEDSKKALDHGKNATGQFCGKVEVKFFLERKIQEPIQHIPQPYKKNERDWPKPWDNPWRKWPYPWDSEKRKWWYNGTGDNAPETYQYSCGEPVKTSSIYNACQSPDRGVTVEGEKTGQGIRYASLDVNSWPDAIIILQLCLKSAYKVFPGNYCSYCGIEYICHKSKYCSNCGRKR